MSRLSSLVSVAAQGSDSHNAPLLFVLLCVSCVRLCLPFSFLPARCLGGKVLLPSLFPTSNLSFFLSLFHSPLTLLPTFSFAFICCLWLSSLIRNKLSCSCFAPCPCFENVTSLPVVVFLYIYLSFTSELLLTLSVLSPLLSCAVPWKTFFCLLFFLIQFPFWFTHFFQILHLTSFWSCSFPLPVSSWLTSRIPPSHYILLLFFFIKPHFYSFPFSQISLTKIRTAWILIKSVFFNKSGSNFVRFCGAALAFPGFHLLWLGVSAGCDLGHLSRQVLDVMFECVENDILTAQMNHMSPPPPPVNSIIYKESRRVIVKVGMHIVRWTSPDETFGIGFGPACFLLMSLQYCEWPHSAWNRKNQKRTESVLEKWWGTEYRWTLTHRGESLMLLLLSLLLYSSFLVLCWVFFFSYFLSNSASAAMIATSLDSLLLSELNSLPSLPFPNP